MYKNKYYPDKMIFHLSSFFWPFSISESKKKEDSKLKNKEENVENE